MRIINPPNTNFNEIWETCLDSISSDNLRTRLENINPQIFNATQDYLQKAPSADLYLITKFNGRDNDIVVGAVTKKELKNLYSSHMVPASKPARTYYDQLKLAAPLNICPLCGFGQVSTLDHYLPKAKFPLLSILPVNLVPSCLDCNKGKSSGVADRKENQCIHPYFDHGYFIDEQWIFAEVVENTPASLSFFVQAPIDWERADKKRVNSHFVDFKLADRFSIQAASELAILKCELQIDFPYSGSEGVKRDLERKVLAAEQLHKNSWKTAMYQALAKS